MLRTESTRFARDFPLIVSLAAAILAFACAAIAAERDAAEISLDEAVAYVEQVKTLGEASPDVIGRLVLLRRRMADERGRELIDGAFQTLLPDEQAKRSYGLPALINIARADDVGMRESAVLEIAEWGIATPEAVRALLENMTYREGDDAEALSLRRAAVQSFEKLIPAIAGLDFEVHREAQKAFIVTTRRETDEDLRLHMVEVNLEFTEANARAARAARER